MRKQWIVLSAMAVILSCGETATKEDAADAEKPTEQAATDLSSNPDYIKGVELIGKSDCLTCHKLDEKLIGPTYKEVAQKYENTPENVTMLAGKIIKGGKGVWGEVEMTAHPDMSQEDAEALIKYVLLQR